MANPTRRYLAGAGEVEGHLKVKIGSSVATVNDNEAEDTSEGKPNNNIDLTHVCLIGDS